MTWKGQRKASEEASNGPHCKPVLQAMPHLVTVFSHVADGVMPQQRQQRGGSKGGGHPPVMARPQEAIILLAPWPRSATCRGWGRFD